MVRREGLRLIDPKSYRVPLMLEPVRSVRLASPVGGIVRTVLRKSGDKVTSQAEAIRLDDTEQALLVKRAGANQRAAEIELRRARKQSDTDLVELAAARLEAAEAELDLAKHRLSQTRIRVPFEGEVFRLNVVESQVVRAGEPLIEFGDTSQLRVEIPVDRKEVEVGGSIEITIEGTAMPARVEHVLPLAKKFEPLRELVHTVASAIVVIDNASGKFQAGQTVSIPIIPRQLVTQIPHRSLSNNPDGMRKVQVVRSGVVRDVPVQLLGQTGVNLAYVTGPFVSGDELILSTPKRLADGQQLRRAGVAAKKPRTAGTAGGSQRPPRSTKRPGF